MERLAFREGKACITKGVATRANQMRTILMIWSRMSPSTEPKHTLVPGTENLSQVLFIDGEKKLLGLEKCIKYTQLENVTQTKIEDQVISCERCNLTRES
jgi:hypothetical protein